MESIVIVLTGTIKVSGVPYLLLTDTDQREAEYCKSIQKWTSLGYPVVFCENSNYESQKINDLVKDFSPQKFEYLRFNTSMSHLGKGNGEAEIIAHVIRHSSLVKDDTIICKATGKNFVGNAPQMIREMLQPTYSGNMVTAILKRNLSFADSRIFFFTKKFYQQYWIHYIEKVEEHKEIFLEHTLAKAIHAALAAGEKWDMLPFQPVYQGYFGTSGTLYKNGFVMRFAKKMWYYVKRKAFASKA